MFGLLRRSRHSAACAAWRAVSKSQLLVKFAPDRTVIDANDNYCRALGYDRQEIRGIDHQDLCAPGEATSIEYEEFWHALREGRFMRGRYKRAARDGREVWLEASYNPVHSLSGKVEFIVKIATVITAEMQREAEIAGKLGAIERSHFVLEIAPTGEIQRANNNFLSLVERLESEVVGQRLSDVCDFDATSSRRTHDRERLHAGQSVTGVQTLISRSGRKLLLQGVFNPVVDLQGRLAKVVYTGNNFSDRSELQAALKRIADGARAKPRVLAHLSHDIPTPPAGASTSPWQIRRSS